MSSNEDDDDFVEQDSADDEDAEYKDDGEEEVRTKKAPQAEEDDDESDEEEATEVKEKKQQTNSKEESKKTEKKTIKEDNEEGDDDFREVLSQKEVESNLQGVTSGKGLVIERAPLLPQLSVRGAEVACPNMPRYRLAFKAPRVTPQNATVPRPEKVRCCFLCFLPFDLSRSTTIFQIGRRLGVRRIGRAVNTNFTPGLFFLCLLHLHSF
jgi:hypothetical protein